MPDIIGIVIDAYERKLEPLVRDQQAAESAEAKVTAMKQSGELAAGDKRQRPGATPKVPGGGVTPVLATAIKKGGAGNPPGTRESKRKERAAAHQAALAAEAVADAADADGAEEAADAADAATGAAAATTAMLPGSIKLLVGTGESRGQGAVEAIERLVRAEVKGFKRGEGPCAYAALGRCKGTLPSGSPCGECAFQKEAARKGEAIVVPAGIIARVKAACSPGLAATIK